MWTGIKEKSNEDPGVGTIAKDGLGCCGIFEGAGMEKGQLS